METKDWRSNPRVSKLNISDCISACSKVDICIYNSLGNCASPRLFKKNKDAKCHYLTNKKMLELLKA